MTDVSTTCAEAIFRVKTSLVSEEIVSANGLFLRCINEEFLTLFQCKTIPTSLTFSPDGKMFATLATDRKV